MTFAAKPARPLPDMVKRKTPFIARAQPQPVGEAADSDLEVLMRADEDLADKIDEQKYAAELAARQAEVDDAIAMAADAG